MTARQIADIAVRSIRQKGWKDAAHITLNDGTALDGIITKLSGNTGTLVVEVIDFAAHRNRRLAVAQIREINLANCP
jgi:hypothetical protein